jgi:hypothetical protein
MNGRLWRVFIILRRDQDPMITLLCLGVLGCGLIACSFDLARMWEVFVIGAVVAGVVVLASAILG